MAAQDLVMRARGVLRDRGWRITNERLGSGDDISVFIIPLMYGNRQPWRAHQRCCGSSSWRACLLLNQQDWLVPFQFPLCRLHISFPPKTKDIQFRQFRIVQPPNFAVQGSYSQHCFVFVFLKPQKSEKVLHGSLDRCWFKLLRNNLACLKLIKVNLERC